MKRRLRQLLLVSTLAASAVGLSGCVGLTLAGIASNVLSAAVGGGPSQQGGGLGPSEQIQQALSRVDDRVSPSCTAQLTQMPASSREPPQPSAEAPLGGVWGDSGWRFDGHDGSVKPADMPLSAFRPVPEGLRGPVPPGLVADTASPVREPAAAASQQMGVARQESIEGKRCAVRPTCLPGMQSPVPMMVCGQDEVSGGEEARYAPKSLDAAQSASHLR